MLPTANLRLVAVALAVIAGACSRSSGQTLEVGGKTMGTTYSVKAVYPKALVNVMSPKLQPEVDRILATVDKTFSTYRSDSEISRLNAAPIKHWEKISWDMAHVLNLSRDVYKRSLGAFDPTVGPLVDLWGFGPVEITAPPTPQAIQAVLATIGFDAIEIEKNNMRKQRAVRLDLSAVAKGYGVDRIAKYLDETQTTGYLIDIGGEMRSKGLTGAGKPWRVGIEKPDHGGKRDVLRVFELTDAAVATSGDYNNVRDVDGKRVSHTIDAGSGYPLTHDLASATVFHKNCTAADAWATAMMAAGPETAMTMAEAYDLPVLLVVRQGKTLEERPSPVLKEWFPGVYPD